jgi:serine protease Do
LALCVVPAAGRPAPDSFADLAAKLLPSVVNISTSQTLKAPPQGAMPQLPPGSPLEDLFKNFLGPKSNTPRHVTSLGSGFIIDPAGFVVTNNHVVSEADEINITLHDDTTYKAKLVGRDVKTDLALLKVEPKKPLAAVSWGDSDLTRVGDWVVAIGNPFGLGGSVTAGILSARGRDIQSGAYDDYLQTDASINRGNSGGPMFNTVGEVIGINTAIYSPTGGSVGIGFAIPSDLARPVIEQLRNAGRVSRGFLGVHIQTVTDDLAQSLGLDRARGAVVTGVAADGPAAAAQVKRGDVIVMVGGQKVASVRQLQRNIADLPANRPASLVVWRDRREVTLQVWVSELPDDRKVVAASSERGAAPLPELLGLTLGPITPLARQSHALSEAMPAVLVTDVVPSSPAEEAGLNPGDAILALDGTAVTTPEELAQRIRGAAASGRKSLLMLLDRDGERQFVALSAKPPS